MAAPRSAKPKGGAWPPAARPLDLSNPPSQAEQRRVHDGPPAPPRRARSAPRSAPKPAAHGAASKTKGRSPKGRSPAARGRSRSRDAGKTAKTGPNTRLRLLLLVAVMALTAWLWPVLGQAGDGVVPTAMFLHLFSVLGVGLVTLAGRRIPWVIAGFLAVLGLIWAGSIAPALVSGLGHGVVGSIWPDAPTTGPGVDRWQLIALALGAVTAGLATLILAPPRGQAPAARGDRTKKR